MIDMRNELYRKFKDRVQEICEERGLHALDWREATIEARARERQNGAPISESFAELGLRNRGEVVWKDELRAVIDDAATTCTSMEEFTEQLLVNGVVITRITNRTISYKLRNYRVCRGDGLGADYTLEAIRHALAHNVEPVEDQDYVNLDDRIDDAEIFGEKKRKKISLEERQAYRAIRRDAFMSRMEIDEICDFADRATWNEKQEFWTKAQKIKEDFWNQWRAKRDYLEKERKMLLSGLRSAKQLRWLFDPRNRRAGLFSVVVGMIVFRDVGDPEQYRKKLAKVNESIKALKDVGDAFRTASARTTDILRVNGYSIEKYTKAVKALQDAADGLDKKKETADDETVKLVRRVAREMELARELEMPGWQLERSKRQTMLLKRLPEESAQQTMNQALRKFSVPNNAAHPRKMNRTSKQAAFALGAVEGVLSFVDDAVDFVHSADIVGKLLADFTAVCQIIAVFRISQHSLLGADFPLGGVGDHTVCCVTSAGEEANVGIDAFHKPLRFRSHIGHGMHQKQATGAVILDFLFPKSDGGFWAIGDHNDILQLF